METSAVKKENRPYGFGDSLLQIIDFKIDIADPKKSRIHIVGVHKPKLRASPSKARDRLFDD